MCRRCSECQGMSHHWTPDPLDPEDDEWQPGDYGCKHCEQRGHVCPHCEEEGCEHCNGEGVLPGVPIPFTQYLRPNGNTRECTIARTPDIEAAAHRLIARDCQFEMEELRTGEVSMTCDCVDPSDGDSVTLAIEVVPNGPEVPLAVDRLVAEATKRLALLTA